MSLFDKGGKVKYYILSWNPILKNIHRKHDAKCGERENKHFLGHLGACNVQSTESARISFRRLIAEQELSPCLMPQPHRLSRL